MTLSPGEVRRLLERHGITPSRALGQNFVVDANTVRRVARLAGVGPGDRVVEVGAGLGALTLALAETGAEVLAVEIDRYLVPLLREVVEPAGVAVVHADATRLHWEGLLGTTPRSWHLVANLPYNVATPLVADVLEGASAVGHLVVMVQREVAERLVAPVGSRARGAVTVKVEYHATARMLGRVPASVFHPRPRVESAIVELRRRAEPPGPRVDPDRLFALVRAGFAQRRKMLRGALAAVADDPTGLLVAAGVDPEARAESLPLEAWIALARTAA